MEFEHSDDEYGFWEPERTRTPRPSRSAWVSDGASRSPGEPTRQLRRTAPVAPPAHVGDGTGQHRRLRVPTDEPTRQLRRTDGRVRSEPAPVAAAPTAHGSAPIHVPLQVGRLDAQAAYFDELSDLLDRDVALAMGDVVPVVAVPAGPSWRSRLRRGDRRIEPFAARIGVVLLVGMVAIPIGLGLSGGSSANPVVTGRQPAVLAVSAAPASAAPAVAGPAGAAPAVPTPTTAAPGAAATAETGTVVVTVPPAPAATTSAATASSPPAATAGTSAPAVSTANADAVAAGPAAGGTSHPAALLATSRTACTSPYTLVAGDYWLSIADRADIKLGALLAANGATSSTPLYPGRTICLPAGAVTPLPAASTTTAVPTTAPPTTVPATTTPKTTTPKTTTPRTTTAAPTTSAPATTATPKTTTANPKTTTTTAFPKTTTTTPKAAATTSAPPVATVPKQSYTRAQVAQIIRDVWPDDLEDKAIAIATRESNLQPGVRNFCCFGLFQIYYGVHQGWLGGIGVTTADQLYDPTTNAQAALALYTRNGGWGPWGG